MLRRRFQPSRRKGEIKVTAAAGPEDAAAAKGGSVRRRREEDEGVEPPAPRDDRVRIVKQGEVRRVSSRLVARWRRSNRASRAID